MKTVILATLVISALAAGAVSAQAQNETDRAMGAGSYIHPNGAASGAWSTQETSRPNSAGLTAKKHKLR
jgi:hypothetical protein